MRSGGSAVNRNVVNCQRRIGPADFWRRLYPQKIGATSASDYRAFTIRFDQDGGLLVNRNFARRLRPPVLHQAREKDQGAPHAVAFGEMAVGECVFQIWDLQEIADQCDPFVIGVGQDISGGQVLVVLFVFQTGIGKLAQNGEASAGAADGACRRRHQR